MEVNGLGHKIGSSQKRKWGMEIDCNFNRVGFTSRLAFWAVAEGGISGQKGHWQATLSNVRK